MLAHATAKGSQNCGLHLVGVRSLLLVLDKISVEIPDGWVRHAKAAYLLTQADSAAQSAGAREHLRQLHGDGASLGRVNLDALSCLALIEEETAPYTVGDFEATVPARHATAAEGRF